MALMRRMVAFAIMLTICLAPFRLTTLGQDSDTAGVPVSDNFAHVQSNDDGTSSVVYTNPSVVPIPDNAYNGTLGSMGSASINTFSQIPAGARVSSVRVQVGLDHTWVGDLTMKLRSPSGTVLTILNRPGSTVADNGGDSPIGDNSNWAAGTIITFGDGAGPEAESMGNTLSDTQNLCVNDGICAYDPSPDTAATPPSAFSAFNDEDARGVWTLFVGDSVLLDTGNIREFRLDLTYAAILSVSGTFNIPDDGYTGGFGGAGQACSTLTAPTFSGSTTVVGAPYVDVTLSHTWVGDLTIKLRSPSGTIFTMLNRPGSSAADDGGGAIGNNANWNNVRIQFRDAAGPEAETMGNGLTSDQRICLDNGVCKHDPSPDTATSPASFAAAYNGQTIAGNWTLCIGDSALGDVGTLNSWSIYFPNSLAPTAAPVGVSGKVVTQLGSSIARARVSLTSMTGEKFQATTNSFGYFKFENVPSGTTYMVEVAAKGYTFESRTITVSDELTDLEFIGQSSLFAK